MESCRQGSTNASRHHYLPSGLGPEAFGVSRQKSSVVFGDGKIRVGDALINDSGCYCTLGCIFSQNFSLCSNNNDAVYALASTHFFLPDTDVYVPSRIAGTTKASSSSSPPIPTYTIPNGCILELRLFGRVLPVPPTSGFPSFVATACEHVSLIEILENAKRDLDLEDIPFFIPAGRDPSNYIPEEVCFCGARSGISYGEKAWVHNVDKDIIDLCCALVFPRPLAHLGCSRVCVYNDISKYAHGIVFSSPGTDNQPHSFEFALESRSNIGMIHQGEPGYVSYAAPISPFIEHLRQNFPNIRDGKLCFEFNERI